MVQMRNITKTKTGKTVTILLLTIVVFLVFAVTLPAVTGVVTNIFYVLLTLLWLFILTKIFMKGYRRFAK